MDVVGLARTRSWVFARKKLAGRRAERAPRFAAGAEAGKEADQGPEKKG